MSAPLERIGRFLSVRPMLATGSSRAWALVNNRGDVLGTIEWYPPWREYTLDPFRGCTLSAGCLRDVAAFLAKESERQPEVRP